MRFWDASAVVPLVVDEAAAPVDGSYTYPAMLVWWGTIVEATSAIARRERAGALSARAVTDSLALLADLSSRWIEVPPSEVLRRTEQRLVRTHVLRATDSLQLAAALTVAVDDPGQLDFVCRDVRLAEAAGREGLGIHQA